MPSPPRLPPPQSQQGDGNGSQAMTHGGHMAAPPAAAPQHPPQHGSHSSHNRALLARTIAHAAL
eukprot:115441-Prorocentrum_lima.AAC.1